MVIGSIGKTEERAGLIKSENYQGKVELQEPRVQQGCDAQWMQPRSCNCYRKKINFYYADSNISAGNIDGYNEQDLLVIRDYCLCSAVVAGRTAVRGVAPDSV